MFKKEQTIIKKYSNRRLYNTSTSTYINLGGVAELIRNNEDFVVIDAESGRDITRGVLVQIVLDYETKGYELLPVDFLKNLIRFYDVSSKDFVTYFLENASRFFDKYQKQTQVFNDDVLKGFDGTKVMEDLGELTKKNMEFFFKAMNAGMSTEREEEYQE